MLGLFSRWDKRSFPKVLLLSPPQTERGGSQGESCEVFHTSTVSLIPPTLESGQHVWALSVCLETNTAVSTEPFSSRNQHIPEKNEKRKNPTHPSQAKAPRSQALLTAR